MDTKKPCTDGNPHVLYVARVKGGRHRMGCRNCIGLDGWVKTVTTTIKANGYSKDSLVMLTREDLFKITKKMGLKVSSKAPKQEIIDAILEGQK